MQAPAHLTRFLVCLTLALIASADAAKVGTVLPHQDHELPHVKKQHAKTITAQPHRYTIRMGGTVDMDNATTRHYETWHIGWQPNESIVIQNVGTVPVENAKLIINGRGDWYDMRGVLSEALASAKSDQEKVYLIWQLSRSNRHHDDPLYEGKYGNELHDPVKMFFVYGAGLCDDSGSIGASLYNAAGFAEPKPFVRTLHGHMMCEVFASGRWQFMDIDENVFYLDRENELPVGGDAVARDHDLAHRELHYGPIFRGWAGNYDSAALFGRDDGKTTRLAQGYKIRVNLRPGERIEYRWDNVGKWAMRLPTRGRRFVGNSRKVYEPPLTDPAAALEADNIAAVQVAGKPALAATGDEAILLYRMSSAYVFCGGHVNASFALHHTADRAVIEVGYDRNKLTKVWESAGPGTKRAEIEIDKAIAPTTDKPKYEFFVRLRLLSSRKMASGKAASADKTRRPAVTALAIRGDIMVSPIALPRLRLGQNTVVYTDDSPPGRKVRVTCNWRETTATKPLPPPMPVYPPDGQTVRDPVLTYKWKPVESADVYHVQVSRDPAFRWPYRPGLDTILKTDEHTVPFWGIYSPEVVYHWRIRTRNGKGIWGDWSAARTFRWAGPRVPVDVKLAQRDDVFILSWEPNARGPRPVAYEVYASDIKGFSISKEPHEIPALGKLPANYLGRTTQTHMLVVGAKGDATLFRASGVERPENLNRCYYRVVAIDGNGTPGGCSDLAEMPHPFIFSKPAAAARVGQPYSYQPRCIRDLGDLQHRYEGANRFWQRENLAYALAAAPKWVTVDPKTGHLAGTPPAGAVGQHPVTLRVTATFEKRTGKDKYMKDLPPRHHDQTFTLTVAE